MRNDLLQCCRHISAILLDTWWCTETCELDNVFPTDDFCFDITMNCVDIINL